MTDVFSEPMRAANFLSDAAATAAHELGVFDALPAPRADLAERLGLPERRLRALVRALLLYGAVVEENGQLFGGAIPPRRPLPRAGWGLLAEVIRTDRPLSSAAIDGVAGEELHRFHDHLRLAGLDAAREVAGWLGPRGPLLDLGGGAGVYAAAFLERNPGERAIIVDRPDVLRLAPPKLAGVDLVPFDLLGPESWPGGARVALLANVLHLFPPAEAARIVARAAQAVEPGGMVAVKDFDAASPAGVLFSLNMALFTEGGEVHEIQALRSFFADARIRGVRVERLRCAPESILLCGTAG